MSKSITSLACVLDQACKYSIMIVPFDVTTTSSLVTRSYLLTYVYVLLQTMRNDKKETTIERMEYEMEQMVELVLLEVDTLRDVSITFLDVAKTFYYSASCGDHLQTHMDKILFQKVL